jgi:hypothetical protein
MDTDHDEVLRKHREKFETHRAWMQQQTDALATMSVPQPSQDAGSARRQAAEPAYPQPVPQQYRQPSQQRHQQQQQQQQQEYTPYSQHARDFASPTLGSPNSQQQQMRGVASPLNVHTRSTQWAKRREQKLDELRQEQAADGNCTFAPEVHDSIHRKRSEQTSVEGFEEFLKRQETARSLRDDKVLKVKCDGSRWTNTVTVPEEFALGTGNTKKVKALQQPLRAPVSQAPHDLHEMLHSPGEAARLGGADAATVPPRGVFSSKSSSAIIDVAVVPHRYEN